MYYFLLTELGNTSCIGTSDTYPLAKGTELDCASSQKYPDIKKMKYKGSTKVLCKNGTHPTVDVYEY